MSSVPANWQHQEEVVSALFSPFRRREVNPVGYDSKLTFWRNHLTELCRTRRRSLVSRSQLETELVVHNYVPSCLQHVFDDLRATGDAVTPAELRRSAEAAQSWAGWTSETLLWWPARTALSWTKRMLWSADEQQEVVLVGPLKELADALYGQHTAMLEAGRCRYGALLPVAALCTLHAQLADGRQLETALLELWRRGDVALTKADGGRPAVKFRQRGERRWPTVTELDRGLLRMVAVEQRLSQQVADMERDMNALRENAKLMLKKNQRESAKKQYRQWKRLQALLEKRLNTLNNLQTMLHQIEESRDNRQVLDALSKGTAAVRGAFGDVTLDKVDQVVADCQEALDEQQEVQETLSRPLLPAGGGDDTAQLEAELARLLADTTAAATDAQPAVPAAAARAQTPDLDLPTPPMDNPDRAKQRQKLPTSTALHDS